MQSGPSCGFAQNAPAIFRSLFDYLAYMRTPKIEGTFSFSQELMALVDGCDARNLSPTGDSIFCRRHAVQFQVAASPSHRCGVGRANASYPLRNGGQVRAWTG